MAGPPEYFARIAGSIDLPLLQSELVVVVGIGTVGSQVAEELARCGVGRFRLIDGDRLEEANRVRHVLSKADVGMNKAEALTLHLAEEVPQSRPEAVPRYIDDSLADRQLDELLADADLIIAATDDREAQRRLGRRALALSVPAIFPALYGDEGGEIIVQLDPRLPCFFCWDGFRANEEQLRGVAALNADTMPVIYTAVALSLGILDPRSEHRRMLVWNPHEAPRQVFVQERFAALHMGLLTRRPDCPSCAVGPAAGRRQPARQAQARSISPEERERQAHIDRQFRRRRRLLGALVGFIALPAIPLLILHATHESEVSAQRQRLARQSRARRFVSYIPRSLGGCHFTTTGLPAGSDFSTVCDGGTTYIYIAAGPETWFADVATAFKHLVGASGLHSECPATGSTTWKVRSAVLYGTVACSAKTLVWCDVAQGIVGSVRLNGRQSLRARWYVALTTDAKEGAQPGRISVPREIRYGEAETCL